MAQLFANALAYEKVMGRWSKTLAGLFLDFVRIGNAEKVLDVGSGTGSLVSSILDRTLLTQVIGIDTSHVFVDYARHRFPASRARFDFGSAMNLPYESNSFDHALSLLVFQFLKRPADAALEMRRVTRSGGIVAACTWERTGLEMNDFFWQECRRRDPRAEENAQRAKVCNRVGELAAVWHAAGLKNVREVILEMRTDFTCFDDFWLPYTNPVVPQGVYVAGLDPQRREALRHALYKRLVGDRDRPFSLRAAALAVRGNVPE